MFETHPQAEIKLPAALAPFGEKSWRWIEFAVHVPYLYLSVNVDVGEDATIGREFLFSHLSDMLGLLAASGGEFKDKKVGLFSTGDMNGSDFYQFCRVREIWQHQKSHKKMFVMSDGARLYYPADQDDGTVNEEMELVISV